MVHLLLCSSHKQHCWFMHKDKYFNLEKLYLAYQFSQTVYFTAMSFHGHLLSNQQQAKEMELLQKGNHSCQCLRIISCVCVCILYIHIYIYFSVLVSPCAIQKHRQVNSRTNSHSIYNCIIYTGENQKSLTSRTTMFCY